MLKEDRPRVRLDLNGFTCSPKPDESSNDLLEVYPNRRYNGPLLCWKFTWKELYEDFAIAEKRPSLPKLAPNGVRNAFDSAFGPQAGLLGS
jgi:hypothetical protein